MKKEICRGSVEILAIQRFQPDVSLCQVVEERRRDLEQRQGEREGWSMGLYLLYCIVDACIL